MKNVISFVLYGNKQRYLVGAFINVVLAAKIYPEFTVRFYLADDVPGWVEKELKSFKNVEIKKTPPANKWFMHAWRFLAFSDREVEIVLVRDVDARLTVRERRAYDEWYESGLDFHIMKDHQIGHRLWPIGAGMWGGYAEKLRNMATLMGVYLQENPTGSDYLSDQHFLREKVWPKVQKSCMVHDTYHNTKVQQPSVTKKLPVELENPANHVGAALDENDYFVFWEDESLSVKNGGIGRFEYDLELLEAY